MIRPTRLKIKQAVCALCACAGLTASAATIGYVADGTTGPYCNRGYGIDVNVSVPSAGYTVEYAESETGPWSAGPVMYTDVCTAKPVWFRISAPGYDTVTDKASVTIVPKTLTEDYVWVEQDEEYVYDGTAKRPTPKAEDTAALITEDDYDVAYEDNVNAGTARAVFTGKRNYTGTVEVEFEIAKANNEWTTVPSVADWTYGRTASEPVSAAKSGVATVVWSSGAKPTLPGNYTATFTVPESRNYKELTATVPFTIHAATIRYAADGNAGTYCNRGFGIEVNISVPSTGYMVSYAGSEEGPWSAQPVAYTNACTARPVWFRIEAEGYSTVTDSRPVTIQPRDIAEAEVWAEQDEEYVYDGTAKRPTPKAEDTAALITEDDYDVAYEDNVNAGTARMVFTGRNNYTGTAVYEFDILKRHLTLTSGDGSWAHDGTAHAETTVTVGGDGFAPGEGATYGNFATLADADSVPNSFDYTLNAGTLAGNYEITKTYGTLTVTPPPVTVVPVAFDALGGRIGAATVVTQDCTTVYGTLPAATRDGYRLAGWFLGVTNGAPEAASGAALLIDAGHTLYANWAIDTATAPDESIFDWTANADGKTATINGFRDASIAVTKLVFPDRIGGKFVTAIRPTAFASSPCGMREVVFPVFGTTIGDKAFYDIPTLAQISFADARRWNDPSASAPVAIGRYAFSTCPALTNVTLGAAVSSLDDYAFLNCRNLGKIIVLGKPAVGRQAFRAAGVNRPEGVEILIDPALASDADYMANLKSDVPTVTVKVDAVVADLKTKSLRVTPRKVSLTLSLNKVSRWGTVNPASVRVRSRAALDAPPQTLVPTSAILNGDGTVTVEIDAPAGGSGFFQAVIGE